ncbi:hypothetical protein niasHT_017424 [Heterodera trifolii]|uniref:Uncharacterized protein n=1 Tax=Heterodera trifolii TaxID=157864 RepID=A0ABD2LHJ5_9BILA
MEQSIAGKTVVAEYAMACSNCTGRESFTFRLIKALSNPAFCFFHLHFGDVGWSVAIFKCTRAEVVRELE